MSKGFRKTFDIFFARTNDRCDIPEKMLILF